MNILAQKWVEALRSGRYTQIKGALQKGDCYCSLGVACDILEPQSNRVFSFADDVVKFEGSYTGSLPPSVREALGLTTSDGRYRDSGGYTRTLVEDNDQRGLSLASIADIIESEPEGLFVR